MTLMKLALVGMIAASSMPAFAEDSVKQDVKEAAQDTGKAMKKAGRKVKDETCEMVNGKMECAAKKMKHKVQNAADEAKD
jgi:type II secretory pathway pseudopilin PulG